MRTHIAGAAVLAALVALTAATASYSAPTAPIDPAVVNEIAANGRATFWVVLKERADLDGSTSLDWNARGAHVVAALRETANDTQSGLRGLLQKRGASFESFWILNAIRVVGDRSLLDELATQGEVGRILADRRYEVPEPVPARDPTVTTVEWGIDHIRAPLAWSTFGDRGEGIVVANIDTGVQYDHPALVAQYRGNQGGGNFDHNYNWFDPSLACGNPSLAPCDNVSHGTHTMGTIVGDDGDPGPNQIGVAPHSRWITAKGCESVSCSLDALLASGQWMLAPTDLSGANPRPDLRPHVVNNSWGGAPGDPFFQATVQAWVAAGIFPVFAPGGGGPSCNTVGAPADYPESYAVGAHDIADQIASFSSRGPSGSGETKPDIAAPGVAVRSAVPGGDYATFSGTSMSTPHAAGTVALVWSGAPALVGDVAATRAVLDETAIDVADLSCGGEAGNNNVWGEGRLDAFAAVAESFHQDAGTLEGTVTAAATGAPIPDARVAAVGPISRTTRTDAAGHYRLILSPGSYDVTAGAFGFQAQTATGVPVNLGQTTTQDFALAPAPSHSLSGVVRDAAGDPIENAAVEILDTPIPSATTDASGAYSFPSVPEGEYDVRADAGRCYDAQTQHVVVDGDETADFSVPQRSDTFGYRCRVVAFDYVDATDRLPLSGDDNVTTLELPFEFPLYGETYGAVHVSTNGYVNFVEPNSFFGNGPIPSQEPPNAAVYALWDDLFVDEAASMWTQVRGDSPAREFVIEWRDVAFFGDFSTRVDFELVLFENGRVLMQYRDVGDTGRQQGNSATIGLENTAGTDAFQYSFNQASIAPAANLAVLYRTPPSGIVTGRVTDALDGVPIGAAQVRALQDGSLVRETVTRPDGTYRVQVPVGTYTIEASAEDYETERAVVDVLEDETVTRDFALRSGRAEITPGTLEFIVRSGTTRTKTLTLRNLGGADLEFTVGESPSASAARPAGAQAAPPAVDSRSAPPSYAPTAVPSLLVGGRVLVLMDLLPWGSDAITQVLEANGIAYDTAGSAQMGSIDLLPYEAVFVANDQPPAFYAAYEANLGRFDEYVQAGGYLWFGAAGWGFNGGDPNGIQLPGGATVQGPVFEELNDVVDNAHPLMAGMPDPFSGTFASHAAFQNVPAAANVIADGQTTGAPTLIEYEHGAGRVLGVGQTVEFGFTFGQDSGRILENGVPYVYAFEPIVDVPWLSESPASGIVPPGGSLEIDVTVDAGALAPGLYRARVVFFTNDPRRPRIDVPVRVIVPAYRQAANAGGGAYTDADDDAWDADQAYAAGSWGYLYRTNAISTRAAIAGTTDDPLYQDARRGLTIEYRFDSLPAGVYEVELRFAEIQNQRPFQRVFDVVIEDTLFLAAIDIAAEVGLNTADDKTVFVPVTDGQLNVRFVTRRSDKVPLVNAIRVTHRPDR